MTDIRFQSDSTGHRAMYVGNHTNNISVGIDPYRVELSGRTGTAKSWNFSEGMLTGGQFFVGAGLRGAVGVNHTYNPASTTSVMPMSANKMNARHAYGFLNVLGEKTNGSYDIKDLTVRSALDMVKTYPIVLTPEQGIVLGRFDRSVDHGIAILDEARLDLLKRLNQQSTPSALQSEAYKKLVAELSHPISRNNLDATTIRQLSDAANQASAFIDSNGNAKGLSDMLEQYIAQASARLDAALPGNELGLQLSADQKEKISRALQGVEESIERVSAKLDAVPPPEKLKRFKKIGDQLIRYDPSVEVAAYVAAATTTPKLPIGEGALIVAGGSAELGVRVDADNLWAIRNGREFDKRVEPSTIASGTAFVGVGTTAAAATPTDIAQKLNLSPPTVGYSIGGYAAIRQAHERMMGQNAGSSQSVEVMGKVSQGLGNGHYAYAEAGFTRELNPSDSPKTTALIRFGRTF